MKFVTNLDLNKNELQNAVLHPLASAPANPKAGQIYYNSSDGKIYRYHNGSWAVVGDGDMKSSVYDPAGGAKQVAFDADVVKKNDAITGATKTKITYDAKGLVTGGEDLSASDIPNLDASKITTGQFADARIASAETWNAKQNSVPTITVALSQVVSQSPVTVQLTDAQAAIVESDSNPHLWFDLTALGGSKGLVSNQVKATGIRLLSAVIPGYAVSSKLVDGISGGCGVYTSSTKQVIYSEFKLYPLVQDSDMTIPVGIASDGRLYSKQNVIPVALSRSSDVVSGGLWFKKNAN